jgi:hypothetical protein
MSQQTPRSLDELWELVPTGSAPVAELVQRGRATRRRRRILTAAAALVVVVAGGAVVGGVMQSRPDSAVTAAPAGTRWAAIGRVAVAVPDGWADGAATCNQPTRDTVFFPYPQDCLGIGHASVSSVALTSGAFTETLTRLNGLQPQGRVDGHQVVAGPTDCGTQGQSCVEVFGVPDLHAYVTVTVPRGDGTQALDTIEAIRTSLTVLPEGESAVPFVTPESDLARYRAALEAAGLQVDVHQVACPDTAFCGYGVRGTTPAAGRVVPAGSTVRVDVLTEGR